MQHQRLSKHITAPPFENENARQNVAPNATMYRVRIIGLPRVPEIVSARGLLYLIFNSLRDRLRERRKVRNK